MQVARQVPTVGVWRTTKTPASSPPIQVKTNKGRATSYRARHRPLPDARQSGTRKVNADEDHQPGHQATPGQQFSLSPVRPPGLRTTGPPPIPPPLHTSSPIIWNSRKHWRGQDEIAGGNICDFEILSIHEPAAILADHAHGHLRPRSPPPCTPPPCQAMDSAALVVRPKVNFHPRVDLAHPQTPTFAGAEHDRNEGCPEDSAAEEEGEESPN